VFQAKTLTTPEMKCMLQEQEALSIPQIWQKIIDSFLSNTAYRYRQTKQQTVMETQRHWWR